MTGDTIATIFRRFVEHSDGALTPALAEAILKFRFAEADQARVAELAAKSNAGTLTQAERSEYEAYAEAADVLAIWQSKARLVLRPQNSTSTA